MKNANELRNELNRIFSLLKNKEITYQEASEFANIAGKMINSAKVQVEYFSLKKESPTIKFLEEK